MKLRCFYSKSQEAGISGVVMKCMHYVSHCAFLLFSTRDHLFVLLLLLEKSACQKTESADVITVVVKVYE